MRSFRVAGVPQIMLLSVAFAIASLQIGPPKAYDAAVRSLIVRMQLNPSPSWPEVKLDSLHKQAAPVLLGLLAKIEIPWVFESVGNKLRIWDVRASIPILVDALGVHPRSLNDLDPSRSRLLEKWGWWTHSALLQKAVSGSYRTRLLSARILAAQANNRPEDPRFTSLFISLSHSESIEFREVAVIGLDSLSGTISGWMESVHPGTMDNLVAFERLMLMTFDENKRISRNASDRVRKWLWSHEQHMLHSPDTYNFDAAGHLGEIANLRHLCIGGSTASIRAAAIIVLRTTVGATLLTQVKEPTIEQLAGLADAEPIVRRIAVQCLKGRLRQDLLPNIVSVAESRDPNARKSAAEVLAWTYLPASIEILRRMLSDRSPTVRAIAKTGIDRLNGKLLTSANHAG